MCSLHVLEPVEVLVQRLLVVESEREERGVGVIGLRECHDLRRRQAAGAQLFHQPRPVLDRRADVARVAPPKLQPLEKRRDLCGRQSKAECREAEPPVRDVEPVAAIELTQPV